LPGTKDARYHPIIPQGLESFLGLSSKELTWPDSLTSFPYSRVWLTPVTHACNPTYSRGRKKKKEAEIRRIAFKASLGK
jgi:hypothetical protein